MLQSFFQWVYDLPIADHIRSNGLAFPWLESVHVLAITLVLGSIAVADLRLLGVASVKRPVSQLLHEVLPVTWVAFAVALLTGLLMFTSNAGFPLTDSNILLTQQDIKDIIAFLRLL